MPAVQEQLTFAEREVLQGAANGETGLETATRLWRDPAEVKLERESALRKLGARSVAHGVAQGFRRGQLW